MYLLNFEQWMSTVFVGALGATFAHSLWQALIALIMCHVALSLAKRSAPAVRYNILIGIAVLLAVTVLTTFFIQLNTGSTSSDPLVSYVPFQYILNTSASTATPVVVQSQKFLVIAGDFLRDYMEVLIAIWFTIFCVKWMRLTLGLNYIKRIVRFESQCADQYWVDKLADLKKKLNVTRTVELLKSNIIKVPVTSGFFKPVIIVPVSLLSNMPPDLVESILLHELAHIKRRDYLVNLLQSAAETAFFFNPFVLKISALIKDERENCCDSLAVEIVQNKASYVQALVAFGEYANRSHTAVAFAGRKNYLLQRVKRILYNQNKKPGVMEKSILVCGVILFLGLAVFSTVKGTEKVLNASLANTIRVASNDTIPSKASSRKSERQSRREVQRAKRTMQEHEEKVEKKQQELEAAVEAMHEDMEKSHELINQEEVEEQREQIKELAKEHEITLKNDLKLNKDLNHKKIQQLQKQQFELIQKQIELSRLQDIQPAIELAMADKQIKAQLMAVNAQNFKLQQHLIDSVRTNVKMNLDLVHSGSNLMRDDIADILIFLEKHNVAKRDEVKMFSLNESELKVNDIKQPAELHEQLKKKYIESKGDYINFLRNGKNTTISMQRNRPDPV